MGWDRRWLVFQIVVPLVAPALLAGLFVGAWTTVDPTFSPKLAVIVDLTPWAIVTYSLTLVGGTFDRSWDKLSKEMLCWLWGAATVNAVYYALLVIRRHDPTFQAHADAYIVTLALMVGSIIVCYRAR